MCLTGSSLHSYLILSEQILLSPFYRCETEGSDWLRNLPKFTQQWALSLRMPTLCRHKGLTSLQSQERSLPLCGASRPQGMHVHPKLAQVEPRMILKCLKNINDPDRSSLFLPKSCSGPQGTSFQGPHPRPTPLLDGPTNTHSCPYLRMWVLFPESGQRRITSSQPWV